MIHTFSLGQLVYAKCGRDKGLPFVVIRVEKDFVYLADGKHRKLKNPKKKKVKHVQFTYKIFEDIASALEQKQYLLDAHIRKAIRLHTNEDLVE